MFIQMIIEENPQNPEEEVTTEAQELLQVKKAVESLDGAQHTAVILKRDDNNYMVIGGGKDNVYVVTCMSKGKHYAMSNKFDVPKDAREIVVGGKAKMYPSRKCVNQQMALESAKHFADRGSLAQTFNWETK